MPAPSSWYSHSNVSNLHYYIGTQLIIYNFTSLCLARSRALSLARARRLEHAPKIFSSKAILKTNLNAINSIYMGLDYTRMCFGLFYFLTIVTQRITKFFKMCLNKLVLILSCELLIYHVISPLTSRWIKTQYLLIFILDPSPTLSIYRGLTHIF